MDHPFGASSPDGRYLFIDDRSSRNSFRRLDLEKQQVVTIPHPDGWVQGMFADKNGKLYLVRGGGEIQVCDIDGKLEKTLKLQLPGGGGFLLDAVNDRLYWSTGYEASKKWLVGYFDMKAADGIFHGLISYDNERNHKVWMRAVPAPFKDFGVYPQLGLWFGPDDPDKNFIYMGACDTNNFFRLDLKKEEVWVCSQEKDGIRFIFTGQGKGSTSGLDGLGNIARSKPHWEGPQVLRYPRVK
jgi:hypothetical protein